MYFFKSWDSFKNTMKTILLQIPISHVRKRSTRLMPPRGWSRTSPTPRPTGQSAQSGSKSRMMHTSTSSFTTWSGWLPVKSVTVVCACAQVGFVILMKLSRGKLSAVLAETWRFFKRAVMWKSIWLPARRVSGFTFHI